MFGGRTEETWAVEALSCGQFRSLTKPTMSERSPLADYLVLQRIIRAAIQRGSAADDASSESRLTARTLPTLFPSYGCTYTYIDRHTNTHTTVVRNLRANPPSELSDSRTKTRVELYARVHVGRGTRCECDLKRMKKRL